VGCRICAGESRSDCCERNEKERMYSMTGLASTTRCVNDHDLPTLLPKVRMCLCTQMACLYLSCVHACLHLQIWQCLWAKRRDDARVCRIVIELAEAYGFPHKLLSMMVDIAIEDQECMRHVLKAKGVSAEA
jgi:hypothetical protein